MFKEDLSVFFETDDFASEACFPLPNGTTFSFPIIFDDPFLNPETGQISLETTNPQGMCKESDIDRLTAALAAANGSSALLANQTVPLRGLGARLSAARGRNFSILQVRPSGDGVAYIVFSNEP